MQKYNFSVYYQRFMSVNILFIYDKAMLFNLYHSKQRFPTYFS